MFSKVIDMNTKTLVDDKAVLCPRRNTDGVIQEEQNKG